MQGFQVSILAGSANRDETPLPLLLRHWESNGHFSLWPCVPGKSDGSRSGC